jgi:hypothetical protein
LIAPNQLQRRAFAAIGFSGAAFAGEATHPGKAAGPVAMSDSELDKVTAGAGVTVNVGAILQVYNAPFDGVVLPKIPPAVPASEKVTITDPLESINLPVGANF